MSRSTKLQSTAPPMAIMSCDYAREYINQYEEVKTETCDQDVDWTWYEGGRRVGMCAKHIREAFLSVPTRYGTTPAVRISQNPASFSSRKSKIIRAKV
jgi:hypothetical protein